jgi:O-antigen/teichoic acid export membrane protein
MSSYSVTQNTSFLTIASVGQKAISFVYFTIIARLVGVENTGQYFFAIAFTTIFAVIADFGLSSVLTRETAREPDKTSEYFNTIFWSKILFGFVAYALVIITVNLLNYSELTKTLIYLSGITMFFDNLHACNYSIFRAKKNLIYESIGIVGSQMITLSVGTVALFAGLPLYWLILAYTIPSFLNFLYTTIFLKKVYIIRYAPVWSKKIFKYFILMAAPFALAGLISRLHSYSDSMLMSKMLSPEELGWWSVPYKITFAFQFLPVALSASVYPVVSEIFIRDKGEVERLFYKSWHYLLLVSAPICLGILALAKPIIFRVYGPDYAPSVMVLRILIPSLIFTFLALLNGAFLNAINRQKIQTLVVGVALSVSVILNLILLPRVGIIGAAVSALISHFIFCWLGFYFIKKHIQVKILEVIKLFLKIMIPAGIMAGLVFYLSDKINFLLTIPLGAVIYIGLIFLSGGLDKAIILDTREKLLRKKSL